MYIVKDALRKIHARYYTEYHADQMARALNRNEGTRFTLYYGFPRFTVEADKAMG